ncbi:hypothetical protein [Streptacidiphilus sp. P02-A3a]|uniref:phosphorylase family protein n=1 Tax=Streptacidiphilus sp. P02-A3a TaxID=2704468 RepID=UPI001CDD2B51|nr:hypothetical protein [Streptacidiphilus sp. P02-A3a]
MADAPFPVPDPTWRGPRRGQGQPVHRPLLSDHEQAEQVCDARAYRRAAPKRLSGLAPSPRPRAEGESLPPGLLAGALDVPALRTDLAAGDLVVCDRALRGEGTSAHYLPPGDHAHPDRHLTAALARAVADRGSRPRLGGTWTTDALYRESATEVRLYARHGVLTADMEAAALFAVGRYRRLPVAAAFAVADSLVTRAPRTDHPSTSGSLDLLLAAALDALVACASAGPGTAATRVGTGREHQSPEERRG